MFKYLASDLVQLTGTTKKLLSTVTLPKDTKRLVSAGGYAIAAAGMTTGETLGGILELESDDINIAPCQIPTTIVSALTNGAVAVEAKMYPIDFDNPGAARIRCSMTEEMISTGNVKGRAYICIEV